ncbi:TetR/AcrR family transcriptional regulator [Propionibacteriaceae bacterium G1746]
MRTTRAQLKEATQALVIDAASRLFMQRGFAATTVRDIAEASAVSPGTVMAVGDKPALLVRVFDDLVAALQREWAGADPVASAPGESCADGLLRVVLPFVTLFTDHPGLSRCYVSILVSGNHSSSLLTDLADRLVAQFGEVIVTHGVPAPQSRDRARALYAAYVGTLLLWASRSTVDPDDVAADLRATFDAICPGKE